MKWLKAAMGYKGWSCDGGGEELGWRRGGAGIEEGRSLDGGRGGAGIEEGEGTRGLAKGSRAIWLGKWVGRGFQDSKQAVCTVHLWSSGLVKAGNAPVKAKLTTKNQPSCQISPTTWDLKLGTISPSLQADWLL